MREEIDLDAVATVRPEAAVIDAMLPWLLERHANPESRHARGAAAARAREQAREEVAALVRARPEEVVFTSGATEANNLALKGAARIARGRGLVRVAVPAHDHPSLLHPARTLGREGFELTALPVGRDGRLDPLSLETGPWGVVAFSHAHAELGALQPAEAIARLVRRGGGITILDATLTAGRLPLDLEALGLPDLLTLSFHHMGGPIGVGALVIRDDLPLPPLLEGGVQERGYRPGSPNLAGIIGAGVSARLARNTIDKRARRLARLGRILAERILSIPGVRRTGAPPELRLPGHLSVRVDGVDGEALLVALETRGVLAATGSPCADEAGVASSSLLAAGYTRAEIRGTVLLCIPPTGGLGEGDIREATVIFGEEVLRLRALAGRMAAATG